MSSLSNRFPVLVLLLVAILAGLTPEVLGQTAGVRIRDIAFLHGARGNQLMGYGIVTGINGDGDKDPTYTKQAIGNLLRRFGVVLDVQRISSKNVAAVVVTAEIPPFAKSGSRIDVQIGTMGDSKTLQGGILLQTPLIGADGQVYAVAQGAVSIGGFSASSGGNSVTKNHPTSGQIIAGAIVEKQIPVTLLDGDTMQLVLNDPDFTMAARTVEVIQRKFPDSCRALDGGTLMLELPDQYQANPVEFIAQVQALEVIPDTPARVILNERTGTVVATARVRVNSCAIAHGSLIVSVAQSQTVSQPNAFAPNTATTQAVTNTDVNVTEQKAGLIPFAEMPTVEKVAAALNAVGATPRDIVAIFQALKQSGALQAELLLR
jgi:flagellar P-ring protein FlgI